MSDWAERDKAVDKAMRDIQSGLIIMNDPQTKGLKNILAICWMDGNSLALKNQVKHLKERLSRDADNE